MKYQHDTIRILNIVFIVLFLIALKIAISI